MRLYTPATSSWSRLMRSSASQHDIEATPLRILHQDLDPGADKAGAGDRTVVVALHHGPAFSLGVLAAQAKLVFDRRLPLIVGGITRIESNTGHGVYLSPRRPDRKSTSLNSSH